MSLTLISHFWNEEFLLPYWLRHHCPLFDHGVLIDYASTDRSREIIQEQAPDWEVRPSVNAWFDAQDVDAEVMAVEQQQAGWKVVLNTTEFLLCRDLRRLVQQLAEDQPQAAGVWGFDLTMVDLLAARDDAVTEAPLYLQKHWGYHSQGSRSRLLHRGPTGRYAAGRHSSDLVPKVVDDRLFVLWFGWCPLRYVRDRKLKIQERVSARDRTIGLGRHHLISPAGLEATYLKEAERAYDLLDRHPGYKELIEALAAQASLPVSEVKP